MNFLTNVIKTFPHVKNNLNIVENALLLQRVALLVEVGEVSMKNTIAIISGVIVSLILFTFVSAFVMKYNIEPYSSFGKGGISNSDLSALQNKIIIINYFVVFPMISLVSGCVVSYIANNKEYILGLFSIIPIVVLFVDRSVIWIFSVIVVVIFSLLGVVLSKKLKTKRTKIL